MIKHTTTKELTKASNNSQQDSVYANTVKSIKDLIGYDYYTSRVVFEHDGNEIVFVNDGMISRVKLYINGHEAASTWSVLSDIRSTVTSAC